MKLEDTLSVLKDQLVELGATDADADAAVSAALKAAREGRDKRARKLSIPKEIRSVEKRHEWCASNGGHTISGFCEAWSCSRCHLSGFD